MKVCKGTLLWVKSKSSLGNKKTRFGSLKLTGSGHVVTWYPWVWYGISEEKKMKKNPQIWKCSHFFVFQSWELRFSGFFCLVLKRPFPVKIHVFLSREVMYTHPPLKHGFSLSWFFGENQKNVIFGANWCFSGGCTWPPEIGKHGFSPEMDVSGRDKQNLKTGAPNFEKQKK